MAYWTGMWPRRRRRSEMRCGKRLSLIFLALLLASASLWAFPGRGGEKAAELTAEPVTVTTMEPTEEAESQKITSGTPSETISTEPSGQQKNSLEKAVAIADSGSFLVGSKFDELLFNLTEAQKDSEAAEIASAEKDAEIAALKDDLAEAEKETGTKAYIMVEGILGFETGIPQFGTGVTLGTRIGNSLMVELGADYMIGGLNGYNQFSLDNFEFRAGIGWMF